MQKLVRKYLHICNRYKNVNNNIMLLSTFLGGISANIVVMPWESQGVLYQAILFLVTTASFTFFTSVIMSIYSNICLNRFLSGVADADTVEKISLLLRKFFSKGVAHKNFSQFLCSIGITCSVLFIYLRLCEINLHMAAISLAVFSLLFLYGKQNIRKRSQQIYEYYHENLMNTFAAYTEEQENAQKQNGLQNKKKENQTSHARQNTSEINQSSSLNTQVHSPKTVPPETKDARANHSKYSRESILQAFADPNIVPDNINKQVNGHVKQNSTTEVPSQQNTSKITMPDSHKVRSPAKTVPFSSITVPKIDKKKSTIIENRWKLLEKASWEEYLYFRTYQGIDIKRNKPATILISDKDIDCNKYKKNWEEMMRLRHPGLAKIYSVSMHSDQKSVIVALQGKGQTLLEFVSHPLQEEVANNIILQLSQALHYLEKKNKFHILLQPRYVSIHDKQVKIWWAGISRMEKKLEGTTTAPDKKAIGAMIYMPVETLQKSENIPVFSSIYSLGAIWHYLLTGKHPYNYTSTDKIFLSKVRGEIPGIRLESPYVSVETEEFIMRMMSRDACDRPKSFGEVIHFLSTIRNEAQ